MADLSNFLSGLGENIMSGLGGASDFLFGKNGTANSKATNGFLGDSFNFLGSESGKNIIDLGGTIGGLYQQKQSQDAYNKVASDNLNLQKKYFNLAEEEKLKQDEKDKKDQDYFNLGFESSQFGKKKNPDGTYV